MVMSREHSDGSQIARESSKDDRQATIDRLQEIVCMLLIKNQTLRMESSTETERKNTIAAGSYDSAHG
jgi:hypothetical protein